MEQIDFLLQLDCNSVKHKTKLKPQQPEPPNVTVGFETMSQNKMDTKTRNIGPWALIEGGEC
jgi:hypothetical protein